MPFFLVYCSNIYSLLKFAHGSKHRLSWIRIYLQRIYYMHNLFKAILFNMIPLTTLCLFHQGEEGVMGLKHYP